MIPEIDPSARMQVRSRGNLQPPASCYVCGSGTCDEGYVDLGTFVDYHGALYFCVVCAQEMARTIGFRGPEDLELIEQKIADFKDLEIENAELRSTIDHLNGVLASRFGPSKPETSERDSSPFKGEESGEPKPSKSVTFT